MKWVGCFEHEDGRQFAYQNTLPKPEGFTSTACARACHSFRYVLLTDGGRCTCMAIHPETPEFSKVEEEKCGKPCATEESLLPQRRCGSKATFAIFRVESAAEVREEIEGARGKRSHLGEDVWPSWPEQRRGETTAPRVGHQARTKKRVLKGISYGPVPLMKPGRLPDDDFMSDMTASLWGSEGRGDLSIIHSLGANTVRLYGNDPSLDHTAFFDEAMANGLQVIAGISDYPYTQMPGNCVKTNFNCYEQVRSQYTQNLRRGFLSVGNVYHPALRTVILMNEPDLKFPGGPRSYCKALISAFDAVLDAEKEMGVAGQAPAFTATFSFGVCPGCSEFGWKPAIGQMVELRKAMMHPETVGYHTKNDIWAAYQKRFINSANTANPATDIRRLFLNTYDEQFPRVPVFIGEYHSPRTLDQKRDLETILEIASNKSTMLEGISFFEYQVRYDKGGSEMSFGMFGLEDRSITDMRIGNGAFSAWCLKPLEVAEIAGRSYKNDCGPIEVGVDYVSDSSWAISMDHIPSPEFCCQQCTQNPRCRSWTWVEDAGLESPGMPSQCWLKGGIPTGKVPKDGVISGVPKAIAARSQQAAADGRRKLRGSDEDSYGPSGAAAPEAHTMQMRFGQCGGKFWTGPTKCPPQFRCQHRGEFYAQCVPSSDSDSGLPSIPGMSKSKVPNIFVHMAVAAAFGGSGVTARQLCPISTTVTTTTTDESDAKNAAVWFGCFEHSAGSSYIYSNEQGGYTSATCSRACGGYTYALLHDGGHCSCASSEPTDSNFEEVDETQCADVCSGEEGMIPKRYCGGERTFAIYKLPRLSENEAAKRKQTQEKAQRLASEQGGSTGNLFVPYDLSDRFS